VVLEHARGYIRRELAGSMRSLRRVPELKFVDDRNMEYAVHIDELLEQIHHDEQESHDA
jgi:ribosome-binding factor A